MLIAARANSRALATRAEAWAALALAALLVARLPLRLANRAAHSAISV